MFYEEKQIYDITKCNQCKEILDEPRILPCGFTICSICVDLIKVNENKMFTCTLCYNKEHKMPDEGLAINKVILQLYSIRPIEFSRGKNVQDFKISLSKIKKISNSIWFGLNNGADQIKENCLNLRSDIQLATEEKIEIINQFNELLIKQINDYEQICLKSFTEMDKSSKIDFNKIINELNEFQMEQIDYLKQPNLSDEIIIDKNEKALQLIHKAENEKEKLENYIFNGNIMNFEKNSNNLQKSIVGKLFMRTKILSDIQMNELMSLCELDNTIRMKLIYKASLDGFGSLDFHLKCDNKSNTFIIIKTTNGNIFGGYTEKDWSYYGNKMDPSAYIFSFINKYRTPIKLKCSENKIAIYTNPDFGPTFGSDQFEFCIRNDSNQNLNSNSDFGKRYKHPLYSHGSDEAKSFLAGLQNFQTSEIEVYTI